MALISNVQSLIVRSHEALVTLKSCLWLLSTNRYWTGVSGYGWTWLFACDGKKEDPWSAPFTSTPKSRGFRPFTVSKRLSPPILGFIRYGSALFAPSTKEEPFGRWCFLWRLSGSLNFLSLMIHWPLEKRRNSSRPLTAFGTNLALLSSEKLLITRKLTPLRSKHGGHSAEEA